MAENAPERPSPEGPALERKDWLGAGGSVLAIALSVLGMNKDPLVRGWVVALMLLAAATGITAIVVSRYRRFTTGSAVALVVASVAILALAPDPVSAPQAAAAPGTAPGSGSTTPGPDVALSLVEVVSPDDDHPDATLDITVRNDGDRLAVLTSVELTVQAFAYLESCLPGSGVGVTGEYQSRLPDNPEPGQVVRMTLHQQVEPGAVDRFTVVLRAPAEHAGAGAAAAGSFVYLFSVAVVQDGGRPPLAAGSVLVDAGTAIDAEGGFFFPAAREATAADVGADGMCRGEAGCVATWVACWNDNRAKVLPLLAVPATRSEGGDAAAAALGR